jgi:hypothetical protein
VGVPLPGKLTATARTGYSQEYSYVLDDGSSGGLTDTRLGLSRAWGEIAKDLKLSTSLYLTLPTSRTSQKSRLYSATSAAAPLTYAKGKWDFTVEPRISQSFHEVEVQDDGTLNTERSISLLLDAGYSFTDQLRAGVTYRPVHSWTYQGTPRDRYLVSADVSYVISSRYILSGGLTTDASALKGNGIEYNYTLFDTGQTTAYLDVIINL